MKMQSFIKIIQRGCKDSGSEIGYLNNHDPVYDPSAAPRARKGHPREEDGPAHFGKAVVAEDGYSDKILKVGRKPLGSIRPATIFCSCYFRISRT